MQLFAASSLFLPVTMTRKVSRLEKTQLCRYGPECSRPRCWYAHNLSELRDPPLSFRRCKTDYPHGWRASKRFYHYLAFELAEETCPASFLVYAKKLRPPDDAVRGAQLREREAVTMRSPCRKRSLSCSSMSDGALRKVGKSDLKDPEVDAMSQCGGRGVEREEDEKSLYTPLDASGKSGCSMKDPEIDAMSQPDNDSFSDLTALSMVGSPTDGPVVVGSPTDGPVGVVYDSTHPPLRVASPIAEPQTVAAIPKARNVVLANPEFAYCHVRGTGPSSDMA